MPDVFDGISSDDLVDETIIDYLASEYGLDWDPTQGSLVRFLMWCVEKEVFGPRASEPTPRRDYIQRDRIDLNAQRILLPDRTTKNGRPRYLPIYGDMAAELDMALAAGDPKCPFLIQHMGKRVFDFKKSWATACETCRNPKIAVSRSPPDRANEHDRGWLNRERSHGNQRPQDPGSLRSLSHRQRAPDGAKCRETRGTLEGKRSPNGARQRGQTKNNKSVNRLECMVSRAGLEPATTALKVRCSTN